MALFSSNLTNEERLGGFEVGTADDESFYLEKVDSYPGVLPNFEFEAQTISEVIAEKDGFKYEKPTSKKAKNLVAEESIETLKEGDNPWNGFSVSEPDVVTSTAATSSAEEYDPFSILDSVKPFKGEDDLDSLKSYNPLAGMYDDDDDISYSKNVDELDDNVLSLDPELKFLLQKDLGKKKTTLDDLKDFNIPNPYQDVDDAEEPMQFEHSEKSIDLGEIVKADRPSKFTNIENESSSSENEENVPKTEEEKKEEKKKKKWPIWKIVTLTSSLVAMLMLAAFYFLFKTILHDDSKPTGTVDTKAKPTVYNTRVVNEHGGKKEVTKHDAGGNHTGTENHASDEHASNSNTSHTSNDSHTENVDQHNNANQNSDQHSNQNTNQAATNHTNTQASNQHTESHNQNTNTHANQSANPKANTKDIASIEPKHADAKINTSSPKQEAHTSNKKDKHEANITLVNPKTEAQKKIKSDKNDTKDHKVSKHNDETAHESPKNNKKTNKIDPKIEKEDDETFINPKSSNKNTAINDSKKNSPINTNKYSDMARPEPSNDNEKEYTIQVYSSPSKQDAEDWKQKLNNSNIRNVSISAQRLRDVIWYRVRFGSFKSKEEAIQEAKKRGYTQAWVDRVK